MSDELNKKTTHEKRHDYWNYLTGERIQRPRGVTHLRLMTIKKEIINDDDFWFQVITRHGGENLSATEFFKTNGAAQDHARGNFWSMIREKILKSKNLKVKSEK